MGANDYSPEMWALARRVVQEREAERRRMEAMTPAEREQYIEQWAKRLAQDLSTFTD